MNREPRFLSISEVIEIHEKEIEEAGGLSGIRDKNSLESAVAAPQASFGNDFLMDIFEMAATYTGKVERNGVVRCSDTATIAKNGVFIATNIVFVRV